VFCYDSTVTHAVVSATPELISTLFVVGLLTVLDEVDDWEQHFACFLGASRLFSSSVGVEVHMAYKTTAVM
jgi:hypothetical protein